MLKKKRRAPGEHRDHTRPSKLIGRWIGLIAASVLLSWLFKLLALPAAFLLGPLLAGIGFAVIGLQLTVPSWAFQLAQGLVDA